MIVALLWTLLTVNASSTSNINIVGHYVQEAECKKIRNVVLNMNSSLKAECVLAETVVVK